jgi:hypothetical protein
MYADLVARGYGDVSEELYIAIVCKEMNWDYWTFLQQPVWFINLLRMMKRVEKEEREHKEKVNGNSN